MSRRKKRGAAVAGGVEDSTASALSPEGAADEVDLDSEEAEEGDAELTQALPDVGAVPVPTCKICGLVEPCDHLREAPALPEGAPSREAVASGAHEPDGAVEAPPEDLALASALYSELMAAVAQEGMAPSAGRPEPFEDLRPADQCVWLNFASRVRQLGVVGPTTPSAPRADGLVRCRARTTLGLDAKDEHGRPLRRVRAGAVCLVTPAVAAREAKHLERL